MSYPADLYEAVHDGTPGDIDFYREACRGARSTLELGCGYGRVLTAIADACPSVVGLDLDGDSLVPARVRAAAMPGIELVLGDMRDFDLGRTFDHIVLPHSGLYCLLTDDDMKRCFHCVRKHLADDGTFIFDAYNADAFHRDASESDLDPSTLLPVKQVVARGQTWQVLERSAWTPKNRRIDATYVHIPEDGDPVEATIEQHYVLSDALRGLLEPAGLRLQSVWGGFDQRPHDPDAPIWVATASAPSERC